MESLLSQEGWLNLGISGAALFIVLIVVVLLFNQYNKGIEKLCGKIDTLVTSFSQNNLKLNEVIISNNRDQEEVIKQLKALRYDINDMHKRIIRIDVRLFDQLKREENRDEPT